MASGKEIICYNKSLDIGLENQKLKINKVNIIVKISMCVRAHVCVCMCLYRVFLLCVCVCVCVLLGAY